MISVAEKIWARTMNVAIKPTCSVHASGAFSLFSALAFASREHTVTKIIFFDYHNKFKSLPILISKISPILDTFGISTSSVTYVTHEDQVTPNITNIYTVDDTKIIFAESLQSARVQALIRVLNPEQLHFYAEGAMSFGPIRDGLPQEMQRILHSVHYADYAGLKPLALKQFKVHDAGMPKSEFRAKLLELFTILDERYAELTEIEDFLASVPQNGIVLLHQNLSAIGGFDPKAERAVFTKIQRQLLNAAPGSPVVFMHPKSVKNVPDIFDVDMEGGAGDRCTFVAPPFPVAEYYIHKIQPKLCVGIFSTGLLNVAALGIPVVTAESHPVGHKIKSAFDSNIFALHFTQLALGAYEHDRFIYPSLDFERLLERLKDNDFARCSVKSNRLWELPFYLGDKKELARNIAQVHADLDSLQSHRHMPAFRRLSPGRKDMLERFAMTPEQIRKLQRERFKAKFLATVKARTNKFIQLISGAQP
jgi:hypothetical protein